MPHITRRRLLRTPAGLLAAAAAPLCQPAPPRPAGKRAKKHYPFQKLRNEGSAPVVKVTPGDGCYVHTYFDVCPFSPSQRYLAATRLPYQDRTATLGDTADVCVIDLEEQTIETVYATRCWGYQTGANLNWGASDRYLYTNDIVAGRAGCVRIDLETGESKAFAGPMYHLAADGSAAIGFPLELLDATQEGYGAPSRDPANPKRLPPGASKSEGVWITDLETNGKRLLVSLADVAAHVAEPAPIGGGTYYFWHSKFNRQGTRVMQVLRCMLPGGHGGYNAMVFTFDRRGRDIRYLPTDPVWGAALDHPNWCPDGAHVLMNLAPKGATRRLFTQFRYDGTGMKVLTDRTSGGGHPSIEPHRKYVITDAFPDKGRAVALRLVDVTAGKEETVCRLSTIDRNAAANPVFRLDGHPVWSRDYRRVCFQAAPEGVRQLFIADLAKLVG